jgi:hypothetical protein
VAKVLVYSPHRVENPRWKKPLTRGQVEKRQAKAVRFAADVLEDSDLADDLEALSPQEYAGRKGLLMTNPTKKRKESSMRRDEMKNLVKEAVSEAIKHTRLANPEQAAAATVPRETQTKSDKKKILDRVDDAAPALADGDEDETLDILNGLLDDYDEDNGS